ncbi:MAG: tripartite tricarboxylate transporter TctB family protein [Proteobacteria bacterium]|nr:tripartite tricarboxylate transporter TctB family protein [Pseudomonadota bacterium]
MRANDAINGLILILLSVAMIALTTTFPAFVGQDYGPALFPRVLGAILIICGGLLIWRGVALRRAGGALVTMAPWTREPWRVGSFFLMLALLLAYIVFSETVGFIPMAFLTLGLLFLWFGVRPLTALVTTVVATLAIYWFFASLLRVPLPRGLLDSVL